MLVSQTKVVTLKVLIFSVGELHVAIRLAGVRKVVPRPEIFKTGNPLLGITQFEEQQVIVLDLHQKFYAQAAQSLPGYLVVVQTVDNCYGLTAAELPVMRELPESAFHPVPEDFRARDRLGIAEQVAKISLNNQVVTAFLLDPDHLLQLVDQPLP